MNLVVYIRHTCDCVTEYNLSSVSVILDAVEIDNLISNLILSSSAINNNPIAQLLASGNQNFIGQIFTSISQIFSQMSIRNLENITLGKSYLS